jgi:hypothetical protein
MASLNFEPTFGPLAPRTGTLTLRDTNQTEDARMRIRTSDLDRFWAAIVLVVVVVFTVTACASERVALLPASETMTIQAKIRPTDGTHAKTRNSAAAAERASAKGGAAAGALTSLACGPAVFFCLPFFTTSGAIIGASTSSVAGTKGDAFGLFPPKTAERVETILLEIEDRRDFFFEIRDSLSSLVPPARQAKVMVADVVIYVGPESFELVQERSSSFALRVTASLFAQWKQSTGAPRTEERQYQYETSERPITYWLNNDGEAFDAGFTECVEKITKMMLWDLAPRDS